MAGVLSATKIVDQSNGFWHGKHGKGTLSYSASPILAGSYAVSVPDTYRGKRGIEDAYKSELKAL
jgi:hypothetical protein